MYNVHRSITVHLDPVCIPQHAQTSQNDTVMNLVDYSDSDGSDTEQSKPAAPPNPVTKASAASNSNFSIDRSNPQKIRVKLADTLETNGSHEEEPAAKRPRIGGGGLSGFNSLLPPPKRDSDAKAQSPIAKGPARKVFSLKTGAEPGFSREADAELKNFFAEQDAERGTSSLGTDDEVGIPDIPLREPAPVTSTSQDPVKGNAFMFKPLSVARNPNKKKKPLNGVAKSPASTKALPVSSTTSKEESVLPAPPPKKVSLFSMGRDEEPGAISIEPAEDYDEDPVPAAETEDFSTFEPPTSDLSYDPNPQNLDSIASDLNLSASERRRLFGRNPKQSNSAINISNLNMDQEYLANEELRATGEQVQHNPLRAIAPGKHSLKQLVSQAQGQKDALEESFASGRRNKKEAGGKYGW
jgi:Mitotic checkpoint regulator, MAD2B-interacting